MNQIRKKGLLRQAGVITRPGGLFSHRLTNLRSQSRVREFNIFCSFQKVFSPQNTFYFTNNNTYLENKCSYSYLFVTQIFPICDSFDIQLDWLIKAQKANNVLFAHATFNARNTVAIILNVHPIFASCKINTAWKRYCDMYPLFSKFFSANERFLFVFK